MAELEGRGIRTSPSPNCPAVRAWVMGKNAAIVVAIVDADGRASKRTVNGTTAAATLIESWARSDVIASLLSPHPEPPPSSDAAVLTRPNRASDPSLTVTSRPSAARVSSALALTANGEMSVGSDSSLWYGLSIALCLQIGPVCAGALARVSADSGVSGDSEDERTGRLATDLLLGAGLPLRWGRWTLTPEMAVGVGWLRTTALSRPAGSDADIDSGGLRASADVRTSFDLSRAVALDLIIGADLAPLAHTAPYQIQDATLAGEPRGYVRCGMGVRIGGQ